MSLVYDAQRVRAKAEAAYHERQFFAKHVAHFERVGSEDRVVERLRWAEPGTGIHRINYIADGGRLIVTGDLYDAIYSGSGARSMAEWSRCDLQYFAGKCVASPYGRQYRQWDADEAWQHVRHDIADRVADDPEIRARWREHGGRSVLSSQEDWNQFLMNDGDTVFGEDWYELGNVGMRTSWECGAHLSGLKLAMKALGLVT